MSSEDVTDKKKFVLVLEPEAAAMQCCEQAGQNNLKSGDMFVIVDAGGGTVDLVSTPNNAFRLIGRPLLT